MYDSGDLKELADAFEEGLAVLYGIANCFQQFTEQFEVPVRYEDVIENRGELAFWIAGQKMYAAVFTRRLTRENGRKETVKQIRWGNFDEEEKKPYLVHTPYGEKTKVSIIEGVDGKPKPKVLDTATGNDCMFFEPVFGKLLEETTFLGTEYSQEILKRFRER